MKGCVYSGHKDCERDCERWYREDCAIYAEVLRLRALCAARPKSLDYNTPGEYSVALLRWWAEIDEAAGRGEGK